MEGGTNRDRRVANGWDGGWRGTRMKGNNDESEGEENSSDVSPKAWW